MSFLLLEDGSFLLLESDDLVLLEGTRVDTWTPPPQWSVQLCRHGDVIASPSAYRFTAAVLRNEAGSFELSTSPAGVPAAGYLDPTGSTLDLVPFDGRDVDEIRLLIGGRIRYSGMVAGESGGFWVDRDANGDRWRWTGIDKAWWMLRSRLVYPDPAEPDPSVWAVTHDERTGVASTVLTEYIEANAGASALEDRQIADLAVADELVGDSLDFSARLQTLEALATRLAGDGGFEVVPEYAHDGTVLLRLAAARNFSSVVKFSDAGDVSAMNARIIDRTATFVLTGGTGQGASRTFATAATSATGGDRFEVFSDQSAMESATEVQADAAAKLALAGEQFSVSTTLADTMAGQSLRFGFRLGDRVGVVIGARSYVVPIERIEYEVTPERQAIRPRLGAAIPNDLAVLLRSVARTQQRIESNVA